MPALARGSRRRRVRLLAFDGGNCFTAGVSQVTLFRSGSVPNSDDVKFMKKWRKQEKNSQF